MKNIKYLSFLSLLAGLIVPNGAFAVKTPPPEDLHKDKKTVGQKIGEKTAEAVGKAERTGHRISHGFKEKRKKDKKKKKAEKKKP